MPWMYQVCGGFQLLLLIRWLAHSMKVELSHLRPRCDSIFTNSSPNFILSSDTSIICLLDESIKFWSDSNYFLSQVGSIVRALRSRRQLSHHPTRPMTYHHSTPIPTWFSWSTHLCDECIKFVEDFNSYYSNVGSIVARSWSSADSPQRNLRTLPIRHQTSISLRIVH